MVSTESWERGKKNTQGESAFLWWVILMPGSYSQDTAIDGKYTVNKNKSLFLNFLKYPGMEYVNGYFTPGVPTFTRNFNYCSYDTLDKIRMFQIE